MILAWRCARCPTGSIPCVPPSPLRRAGSAPSARRGEGAHRDYLKSDLSSAAREPHAHLADRVERVAERRLVGVECDRRHHRSGDDDVAGLQPVVELGGDVGDLTHDIDDTAGVGFQGRGGGGLHAAAEDAGGRVIAEASPRPSSPA